MCATSVGASDWWVDAFGLNQKKRQAKLVLVVKEQAIPQHFHKLCYVGLNSFLGGSEFLSNLAIDLFNGKTG